MELRTLYINTSEEYIKFEFTLLMGVLLQKQLFSSYDVIIDQRPISGNPTTRRFPIKYERWLY